MKNISFLISLLLLTTLLHEAQGMKSRKLLTKTTIHSTSTSTSTSSSKDHQKIEGSANETNNGKMSGHTKQSEDRKKLENFIVKSSPVVEQRQAPTKQFPDVVDLAGMDYSPARRKSPIHN
ncbi:Auxin-induced protein like [Heracleum sosnowskyi]|uniref:Auxin-induced protein like n=1 Tax=Heracleum sosnowskyi TaxID=360622 RepID=A0AAD8NCM1_9APIA|nr:Auxin-induced protein like [Heracleum sosnowskyi]